MRRCKEATIEGPFMLTEAAHKTVDITRLRLAIAAERTVDSLGKSALS